MNWSTLYAAVIAPLPGLALYLWYRPNRTAATGDTK